MKPCSVYISFLLLLFSSCVTETRVQKITQNKTEKYDWFYNLPKTSIEVTIQIEKKEYIPGIYSNYAKKYLDMDYISTQPSVKQQIIGFDVQTSQICDTSAWYGVKMGKKKTMVYLSSEFNLRNSLNREFLQLNFSHPEKISSPEPIKMNEIMLSLTPVMKINDKSDTFAKYHIKDSVSVPEKVIHKQLVIKETGDKVEETALSLKKIREQKQALINGENDIPYPASTMEFMYNSLTNQENELLKLFTGTWKSSVYLRTFTFIPSSIADSLNHEGNYTLCYFSENEGISDTPVKGSTTMYIYLNAKESHDQLSRLNQPVNERVQKGFAYRIPATTKVKIISGGNDIYTATIPILQWGIIKKLNGKEKSVRFNPQTFLPEMIEY